MAAQIKINFSFTSDKNKKIKSRGSKLQILVHKQKHKIHLTKLINMSKSKKLKIIIQNIIKSKKKFV